MPEGDLDDLSNLSSLKELRELVEFLKAAGVTQFDVERPELKLRLKFAGPEAAQGSPGISGVDLASLARLVGGSAGSPAFAVHATEAEHAVPAAAAPSLAALDATEPADEEAGLYIVRSPLVGTFYDASSPGAEPFVRVGDRVQNGKVLCIVEAMKIMNEIESDAAGEIVKVFAKPGQPVEYGQHLFGIRA